MKIQRPHHPKTFFSKKEKQQIIASISEAEKKTSGEIRVHLEEKTDDNVLEHAKKVFEKIGMTQTAQKNGVLIFLSLNTHEFAILGDQGIDAKVPDNFWNDISHLMESFFKEDRFAEGLCQGIAAIGKKLTDYFPYTDDKNELSNEISH
jgi:uncharacterized membrane protein